jgi:succinate dehydrogenase / fumarate reductase cytochrome b subunit
MAGNLQVFKGRDALNAYAVSLQNLGPLLWTARIGLLVIVLVHISSALRLVSLNKAARPVAYKKVHREKSTFASRAMPMTGLILLAFIIFHLLHFTFGVVQNDGYKMLDEFGRHDVYGMVVTGFKAPAVTIAYVISMLLLGLHLSHGCTSFFQSLGFNHPKYNGLFKMVGPAIATLIVIGNCSMPIAVLAGVIKL